MGDAVGEVGVERVSRVREGEVGAGLDSAEGGTASWAMPAPTSLAMKQPATRPQPRGEVGLDVGRGVGLDDAGAVAEAVVDRGGMGGRGQGDGSGKQRGPASGRGKRSCGVLKRGQGGGGAGRPTRAARVRALRGSGCQSQRLPGGSRTAPLTSNMGSGAGLALQNLGDAACKFEKKPESGSTHGRLIAAAPCSRVPATSIRTARHETHCPLPADQPWP